MKSKEKNKKYGFTLIELLIIIAIIGILSTAAVINLNQAKTKAQKAQLLANLTQIQKAATLCLYSGRNLRCGASACNGGQNSVPVPNTPLCLDSDTLWPQFEDPNISWNIVNSSRDNLTFCFEVAWEIPNILLQGGGIFSEQYYCTNARCFEEPTSGSPCSISGCQAFGESCVNNSECCGSYTCNSGTCGTPIIIEN